ncbi:MAG: hypothetical protein EOP38_23910 [Rubrivivax sp.]|nr:MAG: hypothetical protein EOP38_23910 [Rubrivivax sp.]
MNQNTKPVFALKAAAVLCVGLAASSLSWAESPLGLALSETLTYDSNILKNDNDKRSDLVSATGVKVFLEKDYGRQHYSASALGIFQRYKDLKDYDNDGYQVHLGFSSDLASNISVALSHDVGRTLQDLSSQGLIRYRETLITRNTELNARYGLYGRWGLTGNVSNDEIRYERNRLSDQDIFGVRLGVRYNPSDLLFFDVGLKQSRINQDNLPVNVQEGLFNRVNIGENVDRTDLNLITQWVVTGYSVLDARLGFTREKNEYDTARDFNGFTGRASWNFTPRGKTAYNLAFLRDTNNGGGFTSGVDLGFPRVVANPLVQKRLTTGVSGTAVWSATSKVSASVSLTYRKLKEEQTNLFFVNQNIFTSGSYRSAAIGLQYKPTRALSFDCSISSYDRSATALAAGFSGESLACTAGFVID